jgi:hypothetical protein
MIDPLLFAEFHGHPNGTKFRHQTQKKSLRSQQMFSFSTAKSTTFPVDTAIQQIASIKLLGLEQCV